MTTLENDIVLLRNIARGAPNSRLSAAVSRIEPILKAAAALSGEDREFLAYHANAEANAAERKEGAPYKTIVSAHRKLVALILSTEGV